MNNTDSLSWPDEPMRDVKEDEYPLSASGTKKFKRCPEEFRLRYIADKPGTKGSSEYATLGSVVHEVIEETLVEESQLLDRPNQLKEVMLGKYRARDLEFEDDDLYDTGLSCLNVAARYIVQRDVQEFRGVEHEFTCGLKRPDINHGFKGIMDIATDREIWDWKTGKNTNEQDEIIQGMIYAMGYLSEFGEPPHKIRFVYIRQERERSLDPTDENWQKMLDYVRDVVQAKRAGEFPADPGSSKCYWCGYEGFCDASPVGAGGVRWEMF